MIIPFFFLPANEQERANTSFALYLIWRSSACLVLNGTKGHKSFRSGQR